MPVCEPSAFALVFVDVRDYRLSRRPIGRHSIVF